MLTANSCQLRALQFVTIHRDGVTCVSDECVCGTWMSVGGDMGTTLSESHGQRIIDRHDDPTTDNNKQTMGMAHIYEQQTSIA